jgi:hypothetical protein
MLDTTAVPIDVRNRPFEPNVAQREHICLAQNHNAENGDRPRSDTFDASERLFPTLSPLDLFADFVGPANDLRAAIRAALRET